MIEIIIPIKLNKSNDKHNVTYGNGVESGFHIITTPIIAKIIPIKMGANKEAAKTSGMLKKLHHYHSKISLELT